VKDKNGNTINVQSGTTQPSSGDTSISDRNGNLISQHNGVYTDTLGVTALSVIASSNTTFNYATPSGANASYVVSYASHIVRTAFGCTGGSAVTEYNSGNTQISLVDKITLPDGTFYQFGYEPTPGFPSDVTGRLASVTFPTGGTITYTYSGGNNGIVCTDGSTAGLSRVLTDGAGWTSTWGYARSQVSGSHWQTTITDPVTPTANKTVIDFQGMYETERNTYQGPTSGTLLSTVDTCYNAAAIPCTLTAITLPITQRAVKTTIPSAGSITLVGENVTTYNSAGVPTEIDQYTFGPNAPPATPSTKTLITYASLGNITSFPQTVAVKDGSNNLLAQTTNNYDETTPLNAPTGTPQLVTVNGSRGNLTSVQRCTVLTSCTTSFVKSTMTYDTAGQLQTAKDPLNNQTTFSYSDSFFDDSTTNPTNPPSAHGALGHPTDAFVTTITPPLSSTAGTITSGYYFYSGAQAVSTDQNSKSSYVHFDSIGRLSSTYGPSLPIAGGTGNANPWTSISYTSTTQIDTFTDINDASATPLTSCPSTNSCRQNRVNLDGLGRAITQQLVSDPEGATKVDTVYDTRGLVKTASHAHRSTSSTTDGLETPAY